MAYAEIGADLNGTDVRLEAMVIQEVDGADGIDHGCRPDLRPSFRRVVRIHRRGFPGRTALLTIQYAPHVVALLFPFNRKGTSFLDANQMLAFYTCTIQENDVYLQQIGTK